MESVSGNVNLHFQVVGVECDRVSQNVSRDEVKNDRCGAAGLMSVLITPSMSIFLQCDQRPGVQSPGEPDRVPPPFGSACIRIQL